MKSTNLLMAIFVLLATFSPQASASAEQNGFKGHGAEAYFYHTDASGCIQTSVILETGEDILISIEILRYDRCQNQSLMEAYGRKQLTKSELNYSGNLDLATLTTMVQVFDYITNSTFDVSIDLTWIGTGDVQTSLEHYNYEPSPGCHVNLLIREEYRSASASGTVSDGTTNFTPEPASQAVLRYARTIQTSHGCQY